MDTYPIMTAPMMQRTNRHCRFLFRLCHPHAVLYTEMITCQTMLHCPNHHSLQYHPLEKPLTLQLGGSDPEQLALCAKKAEDLGFSGVNLNVGCPSARVQKGMIGARLMRYPDLVASCIAAMKKAVTIPISVKTRIGLDNDPTPTLLLTLLQALNTAGCDHIILHARNAWLDGLSPKQNRTIPPLNYEVVYAIKKKYPHWHLTLNGGMNTLPTIEHHLQHIDAVMLGRAAYHQPWLLRQIYQSMYPNQSIINKALIIERYLDYAHQPKQRTQKVALLAAPLINLLHGDYQAKNKKNLLIKKLHALV
jgi:tRNA-dihydrouridine synthase A